MVETCCTFKASKKLNVLVKCCKKNDIDFVYCAEKYTKIMRKKRKMVGFPTHGKPFKLAFKDYFESVKLPKIVY